MKHKYDIVIIGAGIAGLYCAYQIKKQFPMISFIVLEKYKKKWIGGRMGNEIFHGTSIVTGAGVGRKEKDKLLIKLIKELDIPYSESDFNVYYSTCNNKNLDMNKTIQYLRNKYNTLKVKKSMSFKQFALLYLDKETYHHFVQVNGYSDYELEDAYNVLFNYGLEDNIGGWTKLNIPWKKLVDKLVSIIDVRNIKCSSKVENITKINEKPCTFQVSVKDGINYFCNKVIVATTIDGILNLVPGANARGSPYKEISGQPFLRLYGQFAPSSIPILKEVVKGYTIVCGPLQKIIPIDQNKGIYMIAYSDNKSALYLKSFLENNDKNKAILSYLLEKALHLQVGCLKLLDIKDYYWNIGTHYYLPLNNKYHSINEFIHTVQHPENGMLVVGEVVSDDQGWTEGALSSVEKAVTKSWIKNEC